VRVSDLRRQALLEKAEFSRCFLVLQHSSLEVDTQRLAAQKTHLDVSLGVVLG
jgi:hypothetical protein